MRVPTPRLALVVLAASAALPALAAAFRPVRDPGCARDGVPLDGLFAVRIERGPGAAATLCSVRCAEAWLRAATSSSTSSSTSSFASTSASTSPTTPGPALAISVRDGASGDWIAFDGAVLVRSTVVASKATGERIHAFASLAAAQAHVKTYSGLVLTGSDRPLLDVR